jgi:hypothetical protein
MCRINFITMEDCKYLALTPCVLSSLALTPCVLSSDPVRVPCVCAVRVPCVCCDPVRVLTPCV